MFVLPDSENCIETANNLFFSDTVFRKYVLNVFLPQYKWRGFPTVVTELGFVNL